MMIVKESNSREDTYRIGRELGEQAVPGQVFCFFGDLGVGKTIFSQGFAKGLGVDDIVNSPTFTIVKKNMITDGFRYIILMSIGSEMWMRWKKSATMRWYTVMEYA